ncbi:MAG: SGNH/GDSL hydrolase family protein [Patescibacteria group bacterium]
MYTKKTRILSLITFGLIIVIILLVFINNRYEFVSYPIQSKDIAPNPQSRLKFFFEPRPDITIKDSKTELVSTTAQYTINSDTLHDRFDYPVKKEKDTFRILTIGDSFTFGLYLDTKDNWTELLEDKLNALQCARIKKFEVINLGVFGYDIEYAVERYILRGKKYEPDLIIWFIKNEDLIQINEILTAKKEEYRRIMEQTGELAKEKKKGNPYIYYEKAQEDMYRQIGEEQMYLYQKKLMEKLRGSYQNDLVLLTTHQIFPEYLRTYAQTRSILSDFASNHMSTKLMTLSNIYLDAGTYFPHDYHFNIKGHRVISEEIFQYLTHTKLVNCGNFSQ